MGASATKEPTVVDTRFGSYPILERHSHILGDMLLYAPSGDPKLWGEKPWKLVTANGWEGSSSPGLTYVLKGAHAYEAWNHVALVQYNTGWHHADS